MNSPRRISFDSTAAKWKGGEKLCRFYEFQPQFQLQFFRQSPGPGVRGIDATSYRLVRNSRWQVFDVSAGGGKHWDVRTI